MQKSLEEHKRQFDPLARNFLRLHGGARLHALRRSAPWTPNELYLASLSDLSIEDRYVIYKDAVADHFGVLLSFLGETSTEKTPLQNTLENCLPLLSKLHTIGLRNSNGHPDDDTTKRFPKMMRGISSLRRKLGFDPAYPIQPTPGKYECARSSPSRGSLFQSHIFSTLLAALGTTNTRVAALGTCSGMMVDDGISLTPSEEAALIPILKELQHLSVYISSAHTQDSERKSLCEAEEEVAYLLQQLVIWKERKNRPGVMENRLLPLLAKAAPEIQSLDLTMHPASTSIFSLCRHQGGLDLIDAHFDWISQQFKFSRLSVLSLHNMIATVSSFKEFLKTALHSLKHLTLDCFTWTSDLQIPHSQKEYRDEGVPVCQEALAYLRDHSRIQYLLIGMLCYQELCMKVGDAFHAPPRPRRSAPRWTRYNQRQDAISFAG